MRLLSKQAQPAIRVIGVDGDAAVLAIARAKTAAAGISIPWHLGLAGALPYRDAIFDRVVMSLMLHHLTPSNKQRALREMWRVMRPGGELLIVDFGAPYNLVTRGLALVVRHLEETATHLESRLPAMISEAGFTTVEQCDRWTTVVGPLSLWRAVRARRVEAAQPRA